jgi:predicted metal-dependent HD superfamily phosphohydrolase
MSPADQKLLQDAQVFVKNYLTTKLDKAFVFHNLTHTLDVVQACETILAKTPVSDRERLILLIAAWFHDTGYSYGAYQHEENSEKIATGFLTEKRADQQLISEVNGCIMATKVPQSPTNTIEQIICDADLFHLGTPGFAEKTKLLRQELNRLQDKEVDKKEWRQMNAEFLQRHRYFTDYGRDVLEPVKQKHLQQLLDKLGRKEKLEVTEKVVEENTIIHPMEPVLTEPPKEDIEDEQDDDMKDKEKGKEKEKDKEKALKPKDPKSDRQTVAMFRIMSENHINLSQMADSKANIMISVNTIVLSIMVSLLLGKLQFYPEYIVPTIILVAICLSAVIFAILATRPNISGGTFTKEDIANKQINLLFFGNFYKVGLPDYDWAMKEMIKDKDYLYTSMIKDIYFLGVVLARKYKFLRISYNIFMFGLVIAVLAFGAAFVLSSGVSAQ